MAIGNLPLSVQAKLIFLIENLGISEEENTQTTNDKLDLIMSYLSPPTTCQAISLILGTTEQTIIPVEEIGVIRKGFSIFNESTTAIVYIDFVQGVNANQKKLQLPPLFLWEPEKIYQGEIFAISSEVNTPIEVRIER